MSKERKSYATRLNLNLLFNQWTADDSRHRKSDTYKQNKTLSPRTIIVCTEKSFAIFINKYLKLTYCKVSPLDSIDSYMGTMTKHSITVDNEVPAQFYSTGVTEHTRKLRKQLSHIRIWNVCVTGKDDNSDNILSFPLLSLQHELLKTQCRYKFLIYSFVKKRFLKIFLTWYT
ncbi:hypothetical protein AGLY_006114 [Aphis glycines]|uniref:Uncharacterized protein n=1 Tax=Aphis glycines TaxID=307491 RepID=A0A6G0TV56_APHGL|nr:hypothetical protein AGLY_006114 [Aphis glycines]